MPAIGRVPAVIDMLKRAKRPMSAHEIAAQFRERGDEHCTYKMIGETLSKIIRTKPDVGIRRATRRGFYVYLKEYDVPVTATRNRSDELPRRAPSARVREIREERSNRAYAESAVAETERNVAEDTSPSVEQLEKVLTSLNGLTAKTTVQSSVSFTRTRTRIVRTQADGRVLFIDDLRAALRRALEELRQGVDRQGGVM